jgi:hypothetical protein
MLATDSSFVISPVHVVEAHSHYPEASVVASIFSLDSPIVVHLEKAPKEVPRIPVDRECLSAVVPPLLEDLHSLYPLMV